MNRRITGSIFCLISAILLSTQYICAAIYSMNDNPKDLELFMAGFKSIGNTLIYIAILSLVVGIFYISWDEVLSLKQNKNK